MTPKKKTPPPLAAWLSEVAISAGAKRTCVICRDHGPDTEAGKAVSEFLALGADERHGVSFTTFVREFLLGRLGMHHTAQTWISHITRCLGRGEQL